VNQDNFEKQLKLFLQRKDGELARFPLNGIPPIIYENKEWYDLFVNSNALKDSDSTFMAYARLLQSRWRMSKSRTDGIEGCLPPKLDKNGEIIFGNLIDLDYACSTGCNFLTDEIWEIAQHELKERDKMKERGEFCPLYEDERFICNLLTSQTLCFNLFAVFRDRKNILVDIFNELRPGLMDEIIKIEFEYSPKRQDSKYGGTAFDVFIKYKKNDKISFLGIEVKYTEDLFESEKKEYNHYYKNRQLYKQESEKSGFFKSKEIDKITLPRFSKIWRYHLFSIDLKNEVEYKNGYGYFVFLYPFNNMDCRDAVTRYKEDFLNNPDESFFELSLEKLILTMHKYINDYKVIDLYEWANDLHERYIKYLNVINDL
jgi:hypothetical protein